MLYTTHGDECHVGATLVVAPAGPGLAAWTASASHNAWQQERTAPRALRLLALHSRDLRRHLAFETVARKARQA